MGNYQSEISPSVITGLEEKVSKGNYGRYLKRLTLRTVRGFTDRTVTFDFPVTAVVGPNGEARARYSVPLRWPTRAFCPGGSLPRVASTTQACRTGRLSTRSSTSH